MLPRSAKCPIRGRDSEVSVGDAFLHGRLVWHALYLCPHCEAPVEEDGFGPAPDEFRRAILAQAGEWRLVVPEPGARAVRVVKVLRQALGLSLADAGALRKCLPGSVATGTRAEMERLQW